MPFKKKNHHVYCKIIHMKALLFIEDIKRRTPSDWGSIKGFSLVIKERWNIDASPTEAECYIMTNFWLFLK